MFILLAGIALVVAAAFIRDNMKRGDDSKRGGPPYQLEAAPNLDETREADAPAPGPVFGDDQATRLAEADFAVDGGSMMFRRSSGSSR